MFRFVQTKPGLCSCAFYALVISLQWPFKPVTSLSVPMIKCQWILSSRVSNIACFDLQSLFIWIKNICCAVQTALLHSFSWDFSTYAIFLNSWWFKDVKNDILDCQIHKYTNTNTQIHKYTNTAYDKMTEIPNICYIFEQLVVQGCQKWQSQVFWSKIHSWLLHGPTRFILSFN